VPNEICAALPSWQIYPRQPREEMHRAPTRRGRERRHAHWLVSQGWSAAAVARSFGRDPHTIGAWLEDFRHHDSAALAFEHTGGSPPPATRTREAS
jgi:transposase